MSCCSQHICIGGVTRLAYLTWNQDGTLKAIQAFNDTTGLMFIPAPGSYTIGACLGVSAQDFWRSGVGGTTQPDGTGDVIENIRRDGFVGLTTDPSSTLHIGGSLATAVLVIGATGTTTLTSQHQMVEVTGATATHTINLPPAGTCLGRIYTIGLAGGNTLSTVTVVPAPGNLIENQGGAQSSPIVISNSLIRGGTWQSDGFNWKIIAHQEVTSPNLFMVAKASVLLGDPIPVGARPVTSSYNIASAVGLDGSVADPRMQVTFVTPLPSTDYVVSGHFTGVVPGAFNTDNDITWIVTAKTANGFILAVKELNPLTQNVTFDFHVNMALTPTQVPQPFATYAGPSAGTAATVQLGNFRVRYNTATTNIEMATVAGTETVQIYSEVRFANAAFDTNATATLTTTFALVGDPGIIAGSEVRDIRFSPVAVGDTRAFDCAFQSISATKVSFKLTQW